MIKQLIIKWFVAKGPEALMINIEIIIWTVLAYFVLKWEYIANVGLALYMPVLLHIFRRGFTVKQHFW